VRALGTAERAADDLVVRSFHVMASALQRLAVDDGTPPLQSLLRAKVVKLLFRWVLPRGVLLRHVDAHSEALAHVALLIFAQRAAKVRPSSGQCQPLDAREVGHLAATWTDQGLVILIDFVQADAASRPVAVIGLVHHRPDVLLGGVIRAEAEHVVVEEEGAVALQPAGDVIAVLTVFTGALDAGARLVANVAVPQPGYGQRRLYVPVEEAIEALFLLALLLGLRAEEYTKVVHIELANPVELALLEHRIALPGGSLLAEGADDSLGCVAHFHGLGAGLQRLLRFSFLLGLVLRTQRSGSCSRFRSSHLETQSQMRNGLHDGIASRRMHDQITYH